MAYRKGQKVFDPDTLKWVKKPLTEEEKRQARKERRKARKIFDATPTDVLLKQMEDTHQKNQVYFDKIIKESFQKADASFTYNGSNVNVPKLTCTHCKKVFTWSEWGRGLGISLSFAAQHARNKHNVSVYPTDLKGLVEREEKKLGR
jgi:hypothetical protein